MYLPSSYADSWVEISSQPSSSSLSSVGDNEMVTAGPPFPNHSTLRRQRRQRRLPAEVAGAVQLSRRPTSAAGSSQDEYDESESESDRVMSGSNEDFKNRGNDGLGRDGADDDDGSTALGTRSSISGVKVFTPQPNAFSHPPSSLTSRTGIGSTPTPDSYFPPSSSTAPGGTRLTANQAITPPNMQPARSRLTQPRTARSQGSCNVIGPTHTYQPDHDAALRASLSTLLSCAAAVRASPKDASSGHEVRHSSEPTALRLIPGSELFKQDNSPASPPPPPPPLPARKHGVSSSPSPEGYSPRESTKRKARESSKDRHWKKSRAAKTVAANMDEATVSPVLMGWVISAGVVLVFSAISFSVGYAWGKEIGRFEGSMGVGGEAASCGREAMKGGTGGLRKLRWGTGSTSIRA